jgi:hypothetical protein
MDEIQKYTVRANKGRARIWIEGARLLAAGFKRGAFYVAAPTPDNEVLYLALVADPETYAGAGKVKKVSGKGERPVIDLSGSGCGPFSTGDKVVITYNDCGIISIARDI